MLSRRNYVETIAISLRLRDIGYYMHSGGHGIVPSDWDVFLRFMECT